MLLKLLTMNNFVFFIMIFGISIMLSLLVYVGSYLYDYFKDKRETELYHKRYVEFLKYGYNKEKR